MKEYLYKTRGFTYIELLIVVGIMLIFGAFLVASVNPVERIKAQRDSQRESDLNSILLSVQQKIKNDRGWDCPSEPLPQDKFTAIGTGPGEYDLYSCLMPNYLSKYLVDPKEGSIAGRDITDGLVGHWKFDEGSGTTAYDASGNENHGTLVNGPYWVDGKMGSALDFDGDNDYVNVGNDVSLGITDEITISAWVQRKETQANGWNYIFRKSFNCGLIYRRDDQKAYFWAELDGVWQEMVNSTVTILPEEWYYIAVSWEGVGGVTKIYINGQEKGSAIKIGLLELVDSVVTIGSTRLPDQHFNGSIDDVRIYNRALSADEIQDLYNYEYSSKYAIWQNPVTKNISLKSLESETKEVSTGAPD